VSAGDPLEGCTGFDWDDANAQKNWDQHHVMPEEAEDVFFLEPLVVRSDVRHSKAEKRYYALGRTNVERWLFLAFTVRRRRIRVISVRDMNQNERLSMPNMKKKIPDFKSEDDERRFWAKADSTQYVEWRAGKPRKLTDLKPSLRTISLRLPVSMIEDLKVLANRRDVPYQSLLKVFLAERLAKERQA
jgi:uncharacterized DUF497 family protein